MEFLIVVVGWVVCGVLAGGIAFAHYQAIAHPDIERFKNADRRFCLLVGLIGGPMSLAAVLIVCGLRHGIKFW